MRLAEKLPQGVCDPGFEDLLQRIDGSPVLGGNRVEIFFDGKLAFPAMLETIRSAKREVLFFVSVIGSSNLDTRSFRHNSECNAMILDSATAALMEERFENDLTQAKEIRIRSWKRRPLGSRLVDGMARMLTPVL